ncbi:MAG: RluA family pseudouridine synthase [Betaproteobacteria bacterium]
MNRVDYSGPGRVPAASLELTVPAELAGLRFDQALARLVPQHSRSRLAGWIDAGKVTLDGAVAAGKRRLVGGEHVVVTAADDAPGLRDTPQAIAIEVVHEDAAILVVNKAAGLVVHPGSGNRDGTLMNALLHHAPALAALPRAGIVHRLDKDTSGLLVVAKTPEAQTDLVRQLAARTVKREYVAVVRGDLARAATIDAPIGRHPTARTTMAVVTAGKPARTHVTPVERFGPATLVRCALETGRTHQIRVHLAAVGLALVGDPTYGSRRAAPGLPPFPRQALHAARLGLVHPQTHRARQFEAPLPDDLAALIAALRERTR